MLTFFLCLTYLTNFFVIRLITDVIIIPGSTRISLFLSSYLFKFLFNMNQILSIHAIYIYILVEFNKDGVDFLPLYDVSIEFYK